VRLLTPSGRVTDMERNALNLTEHGHTDPL
jgi:hypothetical protein